MQNPDNYTILKGMYTHISSNGGSNVKIPFFVQSYDGIGVFFYIHNDNTDKQNTFKFDDNCKLTYITGGVPVQMEDGESIFFGVTTVRTVNFMPNGGTFFRVTLESYKNFIQNIIDRELPWENVELIHFDKKLHCSLEGTWSSTEFVKGGSYRKRTRRSTHRKPTKRRRNRRRNRKTKKN
jgi:hypothetical protein